MFLLIYVTVNITTVIL